MRKMFKWLTAVVTAVGLGTGPPAARATPLPPGGQVVPDSAALSGMILADTGVMTGKAPFSDFTVELRQLVINEGAANPLGGLTFAYQVKNLSPMPPATPQHTIARVTTIDFGGWKTDVHFDKGVFAPFVAGTREPIKADRSKDAGSIIGFDFGDSVTGIMPGQTSFVFFIRTDAPLFQPGSSAAINGGAVNFLTFAPAIPEPASVVMMGLGALTLGGWYARRRRSLT